MNQSNYNTWNLGPDIPRKGGGVSGPSFFCHCFRLLLALQEREQIDEFLFVGIAGDAGAAARQGQGVFPA